jgi:hypothetical protein
MTFYGGPSEFVRRLNFLHDQNITGKYHFSEACQGYPWNVSGLRDVRI